MRLRYAIYTTILLSSLVLSGCGTSRKISKVGLRELSSDEAGLSRDRVSELRAKIQNLDHISGSCPPEVRKNFSALASVKALPPNCPAGFVEKVQIARPLLNMEEQSIVDEIVNVNCRNLVDSKRDGDLRHFAESFESSGPIGRHRGEAKSEDEEDLKEGIDKLVTLKNALNEILAINIPFERWLERNGYYVLPEGDLDFFYNLIVQNSCRVTGDIVDDGIHAVRAIEDLQRLLPENEAKGDLKKFSNELQKLIGKKIGDFFH
jgi:hypothetical protein